MFQGIKTYQYPVGNFSIEQEGSTIYSVRKMVDGAWLFQGRTKGCSMDSAMINWLRVINGETEQ